MWIDVLGEDELVNGQWKEIDCSGLSLLLIRYNNGFYAIENLCTHDGGPLSDGELEADEIICPRHGARFCIKTGAVSAPPAYEDVMSFTAKVEGGRVLLDI